MIITSIKSFQKKTAVDSIVAGKERGNGCFVGGLGVLLFWSIFCLPLLCWAGDDDDICIAPLEAYEAFIGWSPNREKILAKLDPDVRSSVTDIGYIDSPDCFFKKSTNKKRAGDIALTGLQRRLDNLGKSLETQEGIFQIRAIVSWLEKNGNNQGGDLVASFLHDLKYEKRRNQKILEQFMYLMDRHSDLVPIYLNHFPELGENGFLSQEVCEVARLAPLEYKAIIGLAYLIHLYDLEIGSMAPDDIPWSSQGTQRYECMKTLLYALPDGSHMDALYQNVTDLHVRRVLKEAEGSLNRFRKEPKSNKIIKKAFRQFLTRINEPVTLEEWKRVNSSKCVNYRGVAGDNYSESIWCQSCSQKKKSWKSEVYFHMDLEDDTCTLQQAKFSVESGSPVLLRELREIANEQIGVLSVPSEDIHEFGSSYWYPVYQRKADTSLAYLYSRSESIGDHPTEWINLLFRRDPLEGRIRKDDEFPLYEYYEPTLPESIDEWAAQACKETGLSHCKAALLAVRAKNEQEIARFVEHAYTILRSKNMSDPQYTALVYWGEYLATRSAKLGEEDSKRLELEWRDYPFSEGFFFVRSDFYQMALNRLDDRWGQRAFIQMTRRGWEVGGACRSGWDQYRRVIKHGETYLTTYPNEIITPYVRFELAEAYQTWWSLAQASKHSDYVNSKEHLPGSDKARRRSIDLFKLFLNGSEDASLGLEVNNHLSVRIQESLFYLKHKLDPRRWKYYCIYD